MKDVIEYMSRFCGIQSDVDGVTPGKVFFVCLRYYHDDENVINMGMDVKSQATLIDREVKNWKKLDWREILLGEYIDVLRSIKEPNTGSVDPEYIRFSLTRMSNRIAANSRRSSGNLIFTNSAAIKEANDSAYADDAILDVVQCKNLVGDESYMIRKVKHPDMKYDDFIVFSCRENGDDLEYGFTLVDYHPERHFIKFTGV